MRTRSGMSYPRRSIPTTNNNDKRRRGDDSADTQFSLCLKKTNASSSEFPPPTTDVFDELPEDLVLFILTKLISTASSPADFIGVLITCKRLNGLGLNPLVLSKASPNALAVKANNWSEYAHTFLKLCGKAGNIDACFMLGMIQFYCFEERGIGMAMIRTAAMRLHPEAMFSQAVINFNGSGGDKTNRDLRTAVALCGRASSLGHVDSLREFGHCLHDGYGIAKNINQGRKLLVQANTREIAYFFAAQKPARLSLPARKWLEYITEHNKLQLPYYETVGFYLLPTCPLLSDFGCDVVPQVPHPANRFLSEWFAAEPPQDGMRMCSHAGCGRPETRVREFRRCSNCSRACYCSRACQALDWKKRHKGECAANPGLQELPEEAAAVAGVDGEGMNAGVVEN